MAEKILHVARICACTGHSDCSTDLLFFDSTLNVITSLKKLGRTIGIQGLLRDMQWAQRVRLWATFFSEVCVHAR